MTHVDIEVDCKKDNNNEKPLLIRTGKKPGESCINRCCIKVFMIIIICVIVYTFGFGVFYYLARKSGDYELPGYKHHEGAIFFAMMWPISMFIVIPKMFADYIIKVIETSYLQGLDN